MYKKKDYLIFRKAKWENRQNSLNFWSRHNAQTTVCRWHGPSLRDSGRSSNTKQHFRADARDVLSPPSGHLSIVLLPIHGSGLDMLCRWLDLLLSVLGQISVCQCVARVKFAYSDCSIYSSGFRSGCLTVGSGGISYQWKSLLQGIHGS
jgi:hypothetical protein